MSVFSGAQGKGAMATHRKRKRMRAYDRAATVRSRQWPCGHVHGAVVCDVPENDEQETRDA